MSFFLRHMARLESLGLASVEPAGGGTGGGGGGGAPLTDEQTAAITTLMGTTVNNMLTARLKTFEKQLHEKLGSTMAETLAARLPDLLKQLQGEPPADDKGGGKKDKNTQESVQLATITRQLEEQKQRSEAFEQKWAAERTARRQAGLTQTVASALALHGIEGVRSEAAIAWLNSQGRIGFEDDDSDNVVFKDDAGLATQLDVGLRQWAKSEHAKIFLPGTNTRGSGGRPGGGPLSGGTGGKLDQKQIGSVLNDLLDRNL